MVCSTYKHKTFKYRQNVLEDIIVERRTIGKKKNKVVESVVDI